ncbi:MAG: hypothetical protein IPL63_14475 [Saprospiraceae bacterium]|nr:hypothetical protein [Saprospiraceae bacterium]
MYTKYGEMPIKREISCTIHLVNEEYDQMEKFFCKNVTLTDGNVTGGYCKSCFGF